MLTPNCFGTGNEHKLNLGANLHGPRTQMDVPFCDEAGTTCRETHVRRRIVGSVDCALSRERPGISRFSLYSDLHGCRSFTPNDSRTADTLATLCALQSICRLVAWSAPLLELCPQNLLVRQPEIA
jgi:hypothetical protein